MPKQLSEALRKSMLDAADVFWQDMVHDWVWKKQAGVTSVPGYIPVCSWAMFKADVTGAYKAAEMAEYQKHVQAYGTTGSAAYLKTFRSYMENMTSLSSFGREVLDKLTDDQIMTVFMMLTSSGCHGSLVTDWDQMPYAARNSQVKEGTVEDFMVTTCADYEPDKHHRQKLIDFLLGPKSPYKQLLECGFFCHYYMDGRIAGVSFFIEDIPPELRHNLKNFCIALRQAREHHKFADIFSDMIDEGADPRVAFLTAYDVSLMSIPSGDQKIYSVVNTTNCNGGHFPISISFDSGFNVTRFFTGNINVQLGLEKRQTNFGVLPANVNSTFGDSPENRLDPVEWITALKEGADGGASTSRFSTNVNPRYKSLKRLVEVATNFLIGKGAVI